MPANSRWDLIQDLKGYLTTRSVLTSPAAVDQMPGGQQNDLQAGPSQDFFATAVQKLPKDFLIWCFFPPCLFVLALVAINSLTSNSYTTASDQMGIHTNAESRLPESKSDSSSLASQIFCFFGITGSENNGSCSQETSVGKWNFISQVRVWLHIPSQCDALEQQQYSKTLYFNQAPNIYLSKESLNSLRVLLRKGTPFSQVCDKLHTAFLMSFFFFLFFYTKRFHTMVSVSCLWLLSWCDYSRLIVSTISIFLDRLLKHIATLCGAVAVSKIKLVRF